MNGLLKTLIKPDWDDNPKRSKILHAANLLQIGEFQLIQLAYKVWYNQDLPEDKINKIFSEYMITGIIPIWVTYYAQRYFKIRIKQMYLIVMMKNIMFMITNLELIFTMNKQRRRRGIFYAIIIAFVFIASHYMAINYVEMRNLQVFIHLY